MSRQASGTLLVILSAIAFGTMALFIRKSTFAGFGDLTLLCVRFGIASVFLGALVLAQRQKLGKGKLLPLILMGGLYVGQSYCYFAALNHAPASLVSLMLYLYPGIVTLIAVAFMGERLTGIKALALALAVVGTIFTILPIGRVTPLGLVFGLGTALFYSAYLLIGSKVMKDVPPLVGSFTIITTAALMYLASSLAAGWNFPEQNVGWMWAVLLALISTVVAIATLLAGLERIGPINASTLSALEPAITAILAILFLGEVLLFNQVAGGVMILVAVIVLARASNVVPQASIEPPR